MGFVFFLGHYASICCRQYSFCFYFGNQRLAMPRRNENTSQASPKKERKKERNSADRETVTLSWLPSEKRDARCYAALCSLGFCLSPQMKCLEGHQREIMGLVIIDHWAQKSVSARFVFFLGHYASICCRQYSFCFYFGNQRLAMPRRNENTSQASPKKERKKERKKEILPIGRQSHKVGYLRRNERRGAT